MLPRAHRLGFAFALGALAVGWGNPAWAARPVTYVWLFASDGSDAKEIAEKVTDEFEVALLDAGCVSLVERREIKKLFDHQKNELAITSTSSLADTDRDELRARKADSMVFGKITEDFESGHIRIEVKLQTMAGETLAGKRVLLTKGKRLDAVERESMMQKLADDLCRSVGKALGQEPTAGTETAPDADPLAARTAELARNDEAAVLLLDQAARGKVATGTVRTFYFSGERNVPLHFSMTAKGSCNFDFMILDTQDKALISPTSGSAYSPDAKEVGFTPPRNGSYKAVVKATSGFGDFTLLLRRLEDVSIP
jgi:hypothetical protein